MIKIGEVISTHKISSKVIISVQLKNDFDKINLNGVYVKFNDGEEIAQFDGFKWWPEKKELDLMFNFEINLPDIGSKVFIVYNG